MPVPNPDSIARKPVDLTRPTPRPQRLRWTRPHGGSRRPAHLFESSITQTGPPAQRDAFLQKIVETCASRVAVLDETGKIMFVSKSWYSSAQRDRTTRSQNPWPLAGFKRADSGSPDALALSQDIEEILSGALSEFHHEYHYQDEGGKRWFGVHAARLDLPESDRFRVLLNFEERTKEREAEQRLLDLGGRLISAQEEERRRIALELHDDLNQRLALLSVELDQIAQRIPEAQADVRWSIQDARARVREVSKTIQRVAYRLHPSKLDHLGLPAAVRSLCAEMARHHEITINYRNRACPSLLSKDVTLCLYRIVQESLRNVIKHSGSQQATVVLCGTAGLVRLFISDPGKGFDVHSPKTKGGLGLIGMTERLRSVGGEISIVSNDRGTKIKVSIPVCGEKPPDERWPCESVTLPRGTTARPWP